ncbi:hypothetical protein Tco_0769766 [Tanacetum coccineum]|uniref:Uncharacterized protein n=1 Tax=Tanacetum coccineum TaxID=301880 RepID=A0ABQ4ZDL5_9ASTR
MGDLSFESTKITILTKSCKPCMSAIFAALQVCSIVNDSLGVTQMLIVIVQIAYHWIDVSKDEVNFYGSEAPTRIKAQPLLSYEKLAPTVNFWRETTLLQASLLQRKVEAYASYVIPATRAIREPRVVVQTSEVDILDDGYRRRKFPVLFGVLKERDKVLPRRVRIYAGRSQISIHSQTPLKEATINSAKLHYNPTYPEGDKIVIVQLLLDTPNSLLQIVHYICDRPINYSEWSILQRIVFGALVYFIWLQRNLRHFQQQKRSLDELCSIIRENIRVRLISLKIRDSWQSCGSHLEFSCF